MNRPHTAGELLRDKRNEITAELVRQIFIYDPDTGSLTNRYGCCNARTGQEAGCISSTDGGYRIVSLCRKKRLVHRVIWLMQTGNWPKHFIDHINGDRLDNRWANLREATRLENNRNTKARGRLLKGVKQEKSGKFSGRINVCGKPIPLGTFNTEEEAHAAYVEAAKKYFGDFARAA